MAKAKFYGTGRRKKSVARVYLVPGTGNITINKRDIDEYLGLETLKVVVRQPLVATETADKFDVIVNVKGGGYTGQAGAIIPFHCTLKFRCAIIMSIREGAAIAGGKMEVFYDGSFRGRAEHPAQGPCGTQRAGGHPALPGLSHSGLSPHCPLAVRAQALFPRPLGQPAGSA